MKTPPFLWLNRQRIVPAKELQGGITKKIVQSAYPAIVKKATPDSVLNALDEIVVTLVSDRRMASLHCEFLGDDSPTDVITFHHGEIVLSAETAQREARERKLPLPQEIARYAVHGLLHLAGWMDDTPRTAAAMRDVQEEILRRACGDLC